MSGGTADKGDPLPPDAVLWRRIHPDQVVADEERPGRLRASSGAFEDSTDGSGMSVHLPAAGETGREYLASVDASREGIAEIPVRELYQSGFWFAHRPEPNDPNHYEVLPVPEKRKDRERKKRKIAGLAKRELLVEPEMREPLR